MPIFLDGNPHWTKRFESWHGSQHNRWFAFWKPGMLFSRWIQVTRKPRSATCPIDTWQIVRSYKVDYK